jgi:acyl-CoA reductase-like NAD-dependent aldehyde dehydrogenase
MSSYTHTIDGKAAAGAKTFGVIDPSTGEVFERAPEATREQLDQAVEAARRAFPAWSATPVAERRRRLLAAADAIESQAERIGRVLTREQGKPLAMAIGEAHGTVGWLRATAAIDLPVEIAQDDAFVRAEIHRRPLGVVAAITPWNFPVVMAAWKIAPALVTGNTIVLKPSPYTPLSTLLLGEILREVFPAGVLNVLSGGDELGRWMTAHPGFAKIGFTGSVDTGKAIMAAAAPDLKRITLELGGNDAGIVLPDADVAAIAPKLFEAAFVNSGQACTALKRLYVHDSIHDEMCARLVEIGRAKKVGPGTESDVDLGPLNNEMQFRRVTELVEDAKRNGARILLGGEPMKRPGYFYPVTLVADVTDGMRLVDEEQFGPVMPILRFSDVDDAIERANALKYGLGGSVWTRDTERGVSLASRLECGTAWVNQHLQVGPHLPFGGMKWSGLGRENGVCGLEAYTEIQVRNIAKV